jgi:hypothetical protein
MGMLRGLDEHELVASLEYQGKGVILVDGQPGMLTKYRISNYQTSSERISVHPHAGQRTDVFQR